MAHARFSPLALALALCLLPACKKTHGDKGGGHVEGPPPRPAGSADQVAPPAAPGGRDFGRDPAVVEVEPAGEILGLGDIHGDYDRLVALLAAAHVIARAPDDPSHASWAAGRATLVCTGDVIDKSNHALPAIALLEALSEGARAAGGRVIVTMGNHEAEFLGNPSQHKAVEFVAELRAAGRDPARVASGEQAPGPFLRALPFAARVGEWFFSHGGNTHGRTTRALATELESGVRAGGFGAPILTSDDSLLEARLSPSPWWEGSGDPQAALARDVAALGVKHIVLGHQPGKVNFADGTSRPKGAMFQKYGLVFFIDTGMSRGVGDSEGALLRIQPGKPTRASAVYPDGHSAPLWEG